jgi:phage-related minor tail protein
MDGITGVDLPVVGAAGAAAGGAFGASFLASLDAEASADNVAAQLGLNEQQGRQLGQLAAGSFTQGFGENIGQVGEAQVAAMRNGLVNPFLDSEADVVSTTNSVLALATLLGEDVPRVAEVAGQMISTGMAGSAEEAFDILARGQVMNVNAAGDLLDTYQEYSTVFKSLGLTGEQSLGLLGQATAAGARDSDVAADALLSFSERAKDGSESTADAFAAIGLSSWQMSQDVAAGGPRAAGALQQTMDGLRKIEDPAKRAQIAAMLFGDQANTMQGALFAFNPTTAVTGLGQVEGAAKKASDQMNSNTQADWSVTWANMTTRASEAATALRNDFGGSLGGIVEDVENNFGPGLAIVGEKMGGVLDTVEEAFGEIPGWLGGLWEQIEDLLGRIPEGLGLIFEGLEGLFLEPLKTAWNGAAGWFNGLTFPTMGPWDIDAGFFGSYTIGPYGGWDLPDLPTFHGGGTFRAPNAGGEGLAMLKDGETISRPGAGESGGNVYLTVHVAGNLTAQRDLERQLEASLKRAWQERN